MTQPTALLAFQVPERSIGICWLGQSSYILKSPSGTVLALDPYLSNACKALGEKAGINMDRKFPPRLRRRIWWASTAVC
jgi:L-ascorbate 6-phosphate lactonase